jgi:hypothetical protein
MSTAGTTEVTVVRHGHAATMRRVSCPGLPPLFFIFEDGNKVGAWRDAVRARAVFRMLLDTMAEVPA